MEKRAARIDRNVELMGEDIIGIFLSEEVLHSSNKSKTREDKLRRFINDQESIQNHCLLGSGIHGAVVLAVIRGVKYALKVVRMAPTPQSIFRLPKMLRSSKNGNNPVLFSLHMRMPYIPRRSQKRAEHLLD